jgi:hypothetical protein
MARALLLALAALILALPLQAAPPKRPQQVTLTTVLVENFIASYGPVKAFNAQYDKQWADENFTDPKADGPTQLRQSLEAHGALAEFNALVARYGFKGVEEWWPVAYSVMVAHGFDDPEHDAAKTKAELEARLAGLDKDRTLTAEQKTKYKLALTEALRRYEAMAPPPGNIEVVKPYRARLDALLAETR